MRNHAVSRSHSRTRYIRWPITSMSSTYENFGLMGAIELAPRPGAIGARGMEAHKTCFWDHDLVIRNGMDILQFSPFLNSRPEDIDRTFETVRRVLDHIE